MSVTISDYNVTIEYPAQGDYWVHPIPVIKATCKYVANTEFQTYFKVGMTSDSFSNTFTQTEVSVSLKDGESSVEYTNEYTFNIPAEIKVGATVDLYLDIYVRSIENLEISQVCQLTEAVRYPRYTYIAETINPDDTPEGYLKAVCSFTDPEALGCYGVWQASTNGINLIPIEHSSPDVKARVVWVKALDSKVVRDDIDLKDSANYYIAKPYYECTQSSNADLLTARVDVLHIVIPKTDVTYAFKMSTIKHLNEAETLKDVNGTEHSCLYEEDITLSYQQMYILTDRTTITAVSDLPVGSSGKILYKDATVYSYGTPAYKNNIYSSAAGELNAPYTGIIDLPTKNSSMVTAMCAWRNYLVSATSSEVFLTSKVSGGYTSKTVSTFVGIPAVDGNCLKATANGIIFKSGNKVFTFYPNAYSSDESILRLTDISYPVESLIEEGSAESPPFALSTERAYWLFMPDSKTCTTKCLKYQYVERVWTYHEYPVLFKNYESYNTQELKLFGIYSDNGTLYMAEYRLDSEVLTETVTDAVNGETQYPRYGDKVHGSEDVVLPIPFELDSGQKTDRVADFRQFVETKFTLATLNPKSNFPFTAKVHVDGCPFVTTLDVNSESPFWKTNDSHVGTAGTLFDTGLSGEDTYNTFRQGYLRYSGKGRSVRHILTGQSLYPFKIYEIDYRYRNLNVKK